MAPTASTDIVTSRIDTPLAPAQLNAASLLRLIWLASPALPIGGFSYSEGLEAAVEWASVNNEARAASWLSQQMRLTVARSDLPAMLLAMQAWRQQDMPRVHALNSWLLNTRETSEFQLQTQQMGRSMVEWLKLHHADTRQQFAGLDACYPIAYAFAAARTQASRHDAGLAYLFGWAENMVAAAVKAVPLGQSAGQRILAELAQQIPQAVAQALLLDDDSRFSFSPMLAILSARHENQYSRLFRS
jgi:urease accessory protein